jgi:hypothetical protein
MWRTGCESAEAAGRDPAAVRMVILAGDVKARLGPRVT